MIIELPSKAIFGNQTKIEDGILKISSRVSWQDFSTRTTILNKGKKCWYCGKRLKQREITMDHLYPQDLGGPTIPNNLAPCCSDCNSRNGNLTELQFRQILNAPEPQRKAIKSRFLATNDRYKQTRGFFLPKEWITSGK